MLLMLLLLRPEYAMQKIRIRDKHNKETARHKALRVQMSKYQQAAVASNAVQVTAHGASPGDTTSQLLAGDEAPPLSEEGTVALRCTGNTPFGNL